MGTTPPVIRTDKLPKPGEAVPPELAFGLNAAPPGIDSCIVDPTSKRRVLRPSTKSIDMNLAAGSSGLRAMSARDALGSSGRPLSSGSMQERPTTAGTRSPTRTQKPKMEIMTQKSSVPLSWAGVNATLSTTYNDTHGSSGLRAATSGLGPSQGNRILGATTCPIGSVNYNTCVLTKERSRYPVSQSHVQGIAFPQPTDTKTMYRSDFCRREEGDVRRTMRDMAWQSAEASKVALSTNVPLGEKGCVQVRSKDWGSDYKEHFHKHNNDGSTDRARAKAFKDSLAGPTGTGGALTRSHMQRNKSLANA